MLCLGLIGVVGWCSKLAAHRGFGNILDHHLHALDVTLIGCTFKFQLREVLFALLHKIIFEMVDVASLFPVIFEVKLDDTFGGVLKQLRARFAFLLHYFSFMIIYFEPPFDAYESFTWLLLEFDVYCKGLEVLGFGVYVLLCLHQDFLIRILNICQTAEVSSNKHSLVSHGRQCRLPASIELTHGSRLRLECGIFQVFLCVGILERMDTGLSLLDLGLGLNRFTQHDSLLKRMRLISAVHFNTNSQLVLFVHDFVHLVHHFVLSLEECSFVDCTLVDLFVKLI